MKLEKIVKDFAENKTGKLSFHDKRNNDISCEVILRNSSPPRDLVYQNMCLKSICVLTHMHISIAFHFIIEI